MISVNWIGIFWLINRTVYSPDKYLALYHESYYVPKPRINSVKTPGSLSIKHHSPPPDAIMLDSSQRSVPEVVLLRPRPQDLLRDSIWRPGNQPTFEYSRWRVNCQSRQSVQWSKNISLVLQCGVSRCICYSKISCVSKKLLKEVKSTNMWRPPAGQITQPPGAQGFPLPVSIVLDCLSLFIFLVWDTTNTTKILLSQSNRFLFSCFVNLMFRQIGNKCLRDFKHRFRKHFPCNNR